MAAALTDIEDLVLGTHPPRLSPAGSTGDVCRCGSCASACLHVPGSMAVEDFVVRVSAAAAAAAAFRRWRDGGSPPVDLAAGLAVVLKTTILDFWVGREGASYIFYPRPMVVGESGTYAEFDPKGGACVHLGESGCALGGNRALMPTECRSLHCDPRKDQRLKKPQIAAQWGTPRGRELSAAIVRALLAAGRADNHPPRGDAALAEYMSSSKGGGAR